MLFGLAYRMLGRVADAEDVVQEAFVRWGRSSHGTVDSPKAYLRAVVTNLCLDHRRQAAHAETSLLDAAMPEPLATDVTPVDASELAESLGLGFMVFLRTLAPLERAVFLLRQVFELEYADVARIVGKTEPHCRQVVRRARQRLLERRPRFPATREEAESVTRQFVSACAGGDLEALLAVLAPTVVLRVDAGAGRPRFGEARALSKPLIGADAVARFAIGVMRQAPADFRPTWREINGTPAIVGYVDGRAQSILTLEVEDGRVVSVFIIVDPEKLARLG